MVLIEDMSETERQSWIVLLADGAVLIWFWKKMTFNWQLQPEAMSLEAFGALIIGLIILTIILHAVIAAVFDARKRKGDVERDERDVNIERKGAHAGYRFLQIGVGVIMFGIFMSHGLGADYQSDYRMETPVQIIYYIMIVSYIADLIKHGVMIHAYRT